MRSTINPKRRRRRRLNKDSRPPDSPTDNGGKKKASVLIDRRLFFRVSEKVRYGEKRRRRLPMSFSLDFDTALSAKIV